MTPTEQEVAAHYAQAKDVRCLASGQVVNVAGVTAYAYSDAAGWTSEGGAVTYWKGGEWAAITRKKCGKCKNCNCNDK